VFGQYVTGGGLAQADAINRVVVPAMTLTNLLLNVTQGNTPGTNLIATVEDNGSLSSLTGTWNGTTLTATSSGSLTTAAGDLLSLFITNSTPGHDSFSVSVHWTISGSGGGGGGGGTGPYINYLNGIGTNTTVTNGLLQAPLGIKFPSLPVIGSQQSLNVAVYGPPSALDQNTTNAIFFDPESDGWSTGWLGGNHSIEVSPLYYGAYWIRPDYGNAFYTSEGAVVELGQGVNHNNTLPFAANDTGGVSLDGLQINTDGNGNALIGSSATSPSFNVGTFNYQRLHIIDYSAVGSSHYAALANVESTYVLCSSNQSIGSSTGVWIWTNTTPSTNVLVWYGNGDPMFSVNTMVFQPSNQVGNTSTTNFYFTDIGESGFGFMGAGPDGPSYESPFNHGVQDIANFFTTSTPLYPRDNFKEYPESITNGPSMDINGFHGNVVNTSTNFNLATAGIGTTNAASIVSQGINPVQNMAGTIGPTTATYGGQVGGSTSGSPSTYTNQVFIGSSFIAPDSVASWLPINGIPVLSQITNIQNTAQWCYAPVSNLWVFGISSNGITSMNITNIYDQSLLSSGGRWAGISGTMHMSIATDGTNLWVFNSAFVIHNAIYEYNLQGVFVMSNQVISIPNTALGADFETMIYDKGFIFAVAPFGVIAKINCQSGALVATNGTATGIPKQPEDDSVSIGGNLYVGDETTTDFVEYSESTLAIISSNFCHRSYGLYSLDGKNILNVSRDGFLDVIPVASQTSLYSYQIQNELQSQGVTPVPQPNELFAITTNGPTQRVAVSEFSGAGWFYTLDLYTNISTIQSSMNVNGFVNADTFTGGSFQGNYFQMGNNQFTPSNVVINSQYFIGSLQPNLSANLQGGGVNFFLKTNWIANYLSFGANGLDFLDANSGEGVNIEGQSGGAEMVLTNAPEGTVNMINTFGFSWPISLPTNGAAPSSIPGKAILWVSNDFALWKTSPNGNVRVAP
jgi:hypothetical protein